MSNRVVVVRAGTRKVVVRKSGQAGTDGDDGTTPTLEMGTVTTLAPGEDATATLTALGGDVYRLDLGLPAGEPGAGGGVVQDVVAPLAVDIDGVLTVDLTGLATDAELVAVADAVDALQLDVDGLVTDLATLTTAVGGKLATADLASAVSGLALADFPAGLAWDTEVAAAVAAEATARDTAIGTAVAGLLATDDLPGEVLALDLSSFPAGLTRDSELDAAIAALVGAAPGTLDALDELAAAIGDDPNFATTLATSLAGKQPIDSDLTAIAALTTTTFGRSLLEAVNASALRTLAGLVLGTDIYSKAAVDSGFQPLDSDLTAIAALTTTTFGRSLLAMTDAAAVKTALSLAVADVSGAAPLASPALTGNPTAPTPSAADNDTSIATTAFVQGEIGLRKEQVGWFYASTVATGTGTFRIYNRSGRTRTISEVHMALGTSGTVTVDVNKNGTTLFTTQGNRPATSSSNADDGTPDVTSWANGDYLTCDVDVATSGADLVVEVVYS